MITTRFEHGMMVRMIEPPDHQASILYIHGLGESGLCFERLIQHPTLNGYRHIVPDLPGYGRSPWSDHAISLAEYAHLLTGWIQQSGFHPDVLIGHSMGGVIGTMMCEIEPESFPAFLNIEGNLSSGDCVFSGQAVQNAWEQFISTGFDALRSAIYERGLTDPALRGYYASLRLANPRQFYQNSQDLVAFSRSGAAVERFNSLVTRLKWYIAGKPNGICQESAGLLKRMVSSCIFIDQSGHWPFIDNEDAMVEVMHKALHQLQSTSFNDHH